MNTVGLEGIEHFNLHRSWSSRGLPVCVDPATPFNSFKNLFSSYYYGSLTMTSKTKKIKAAGRFSSGIGTRARKKFNSVESLQRKRQPSPYYEKAQAKRIAAGIWRCLKTGRIFAGPAYTLKEK